MIKPSRLLSSICGALMCAGLSFAQDSHVQAYYSRESDRTVVNTDDLYVINMPGQFVHMKLVGRYPRSGPPTAQPDLLTIQFASFAPAALYEAEQSHHLLMKIGEEILDLGSMGYQQSHRDGPNAFTVKDKNYIPVQVLPENALVRASAKNGLTLESMTRDIKFDDLQKLANTERPLLKIGSSVFALTPTHMSIVREFLKAVTPGAISSETAASPIEPAIPSDVPSDANHANLEATLKWLAKEIERTAATKDAVPRKITPVDFKTCQIRYRLDPVFRTTRVSPNLVYVIFDYKLNLADLDSNSIIASGSVNSGSIWFRVRNGESKIKVISRRNENGFAGETIDERQVPSAAIGLNNGTAAAAFKASLTHAINLCQGHEK